MTNKRSLAERLRSGFGGLVPPLCDEAASEIERLQGQVLAVRKALWDRDEYQRGSASSCLEEIQKIVGIESPYPASPAVESDSVKPALDLNPLDPANPYFRTCLKGHVAYSISFSECPSCKIERESMAEPMRRYYHAASTAYTFSDCKAMVREARLIRNDKVIARIIFDSRGLVVEDPELRLEFDEGSPKKPAGEQS